MKSFRHAPFRYVRRVPSSTLTHVSVSPPFHPGQSDFPSPVGDHGISSNSLPYTSEAKALAHIHPSTYWFTVRLVLRILFSTLLRHYVPKWFLLNTAMRREPLCPKAGVTCFCHDVLHHVRWRYPSFIAHTGSCARPNSSRHFRFNYYDRSLQVVTSPC